MKPRLIYYTDCYLFGGCERPLYELLSSRELAERYDYTLICRKNRMYQAGVRAHYPALAERIKWVELPDICTLDELTGRPLASLLNLAYRLLWPAFFVYDLLALYRLFRREPARLVHINNGGYPGALGCRAAVVAARLAGKRKIVFNVHNTAQRTESPGNRLLDILVNRWTAVFVTGSQASRRALVGQRKMSPGKVMNIYHGIDRPAAVGGEKKNQIAMVAGFEARKGHRFVIRALKQVAAEHPQVKTLFIGDGPLLEETKTLAKTAGLGNNVAFLGRRQDYPEYIAESLMLLNPSLENEDLPYVILEAMSLGIPVIGTSVAGIPEEIEHGVSGLIVEPGDSPALAAAIVQLLADGRRREQMGMEARKRYESMFTKQRMISNYLELYGRIGNE